MTVPSSARVGYREVLRDREVRGLLLSDGLSGIGDQVARIAVALLVLERSGSAFAAAATYAVSYLTWLLGGPVLSVLPDRYVRRRVMVVSDVARGLLVAVLALPGIPLAVVFAVLVLVGLLAPPWDAARSAALADVVHGERYVVANAVSSAIGQASQVLGFVLGGGLVALVGVSGALLVDAATFALSAAILLLTLRARPVLRSEGDPVSSVVSEALAGARLVGSDPRLRSLLLWGLLTATSVIAAEGLAVAVTEQQGGGALAAGLLTAAVPAGFLLGSWGLLRITAERRERLFAPMVVLSCACLMVTPALESLAVIGAVWVLAGVGNALQLVANSSFVQAVPAHLRGRAFGAAGTALMAVQGLALVGSGALAEVVDPRAAVAVTAALCLLTVPLLRSPAQAAAGSGRGATG